jgi:FAD/FMN-containing dehydrogenase
LLVPESREIGRFLQGCEEQLPGRVTDGIRERKKLSGDYSIYRILPAAVARPRDEQELTRLVALAAEHRVPLAIRGGGSGTGGAALTSGVVVLLRGEVWEASPELLEGGKGVRVRPGTSYTDLASLITPLGLSIPADPSSASISTMGGNIATRASGPHAFRHGSMDRYLRRVTVVDGTAGLLRSDAPLSEERAAGLAALRRGISAELEEKIRAHERIKNASGPRLFPFLAGPHTPESVTSLFCGSLGSFGLITEAQLNTVPAPPERRVVLYAAESDDAAVSLTDSLRGPDTFAVELIDGLALRIAGRSKLMESGFLSDEQRRILAHPGAHLLVHETADASALMLSQGQSPLSDDQAQRFWKLRKAMLWQMGRFNRRFPAYSVINDLAVPRERLGELLRGVRQIAREEALALPFYGHAGDANLHFRPLFRADAPGLPDRIRRVAEAGYTLATELGGTVTGEHGLGPLRSPFLELEWGSEGVELFAQLKRLFDPRGILNPGALLPRQGLLENFVPKK